jgi:hypothetical protein
MNLFLMNFIKKNYFIFYFLFFLFCMKILEVVILVKLHFLRHFLFNKYDS